ncbi:MAG: ATPase, partial [Haloarculaceae archaeon]
ISEEKQAREDRIAELREQLDRKNSRIAELEKELQDARDLSRMADQFTEALLEHVEGYNPGRTEQEKMRRRRQNGDGTDDGSPDTSTTDASTPDATDERGADEAGDEPQDATSGGGFGDAFSMFADDDPAMTGGADDAGTDEQTPMADGDGATTSDEGRPSRAVSDVTLDGVPAASTTIGTATSNGNGSTSHGTGAVPEPVRELEADIVDMESKTRRMLAFYRDHGPGTPLNAHFSAGGSGDRTNAYARNRTLRLRGLIEHVGRGRYDYRLRALLEEELGDRADDVDIEGHASRLEREIIEGPSKN